MEITSSDDVGRVGVFLDRFDRGLDAHFINAKPHGKAYLPDVYVVYDIVARRGLHNSHLASRDERSDR